MSLDISNKLAWYIIQYHEALALSAGNAPIPEAKIVPMAEEVLVALKGLVAYAKGQAEAATAATK